MHCTLVRVTLSSLVKRMQVERILFDDKGVAKGAEDRHEHLMSIS